MGSISFKRLDNSPAVLPPREEIAASKSTKPKKPFKWVCSPETRTALQSIGVYEEMADIMAQIHNAEKKWEADAAKARAEALNKFISNCKEAANIYKITGASDSDTGVSRIEVSLVRE